MDQPKPIETQLQTALMRIPGIRAARVVTDSSATPTEIHIVASGEKTPKQLVRDVQTVALATVGVSIDHRIVSVVMFPDESQPQAAAAEKRISIQEITTETRSTSSKVRVVLDWGNTSSSGESSGYTSAENLIQIAAQATLEAVRGLLADGAWLSLEQASIQRVGARDVAVATITIAGGVALSGSAVVAGQHTEAIVRAVLDALNRRLAPMEKDGQRTGNGSS